MKYQVIAVVDSRKLGDFVNATHAIISQPLQIGPAPELVTPTQQFSANTGVTNVLVPVGRPERGYGGTPGSAGRSIRTPHERKRGVRIPPEQHRPSVMMLEALQTGPCTLSELQAVVMSEGYAPNTARSRLSDLTRVNLVDYTAGPLSSRVYRLR